MYDAKVVATFECFELELQTEFQGIKEVVIGGFTRDEKATKHIIGDMSHTYYVSFLNRDELSDVRKVENVVEGLEKKFPDLHFQITTSKDNVGAIQGAYLRVGAIPPTDVSLATDAIDKILGEDTDESQTETEEEE